MSTPGNAEPQLGSQDSRAGARRSQVQSRGNAWFSRGYLPHFQGSAVIQTITFRLSDSLPQVKLRELEGELANLSNDVQARERRQRIEQWLDAGMGCCALRHPSCAEIVQDTLFRFHGERYQLIAWCIMPNHVHVMIEPQAELGKIVQSWKSFTGRWILGHAAELGIDVPKEGFWMREYWDRFIRDESHFHRAIAYIHENPVAAGLCATAHAWRWSSAHPGNAEPQLGLEKTISNSRAGARRSQGVSGSITPIDQSRSQP